MLNLPVSDIMNDHPIKVKGDVSIRNLAHLLLRYRINGILVVAPDDEKNVLGVFTTHDFLNLMDLSMAGSHRALALNKVADQPVKEFVNPQFIRLQQTDTTAKAIAVMHKHNALTIPVYDGDNLVGVVGRHDVINIAFA
ncbi:MAG: CBS domain-containing protein [Candidatus Omnitrophica bacterium]|nr:CBS domain-containing protein [Candidatus Omnitrophota bacterium]